VVVATVFRELFDRKPVPGDDSLEAFWLPWRELRAMPERLQFTERSKREFWEYCRWRMFNEAARDVLGEWRLPRLE
jgi:hypothetical protein